MFYSFFMSKECKGWVAVRLPQAPSKKIIKWGRDNIPNSVLYNNKGYGRELDTHITVIYGVCENSKEIIEEIVKEFKSIKVKLGKIGYFKNSPDFDVVIVKIISEDLRRLHEKIKRKLKVKETYSSYQPHSCIAYVEKGQGSKYAGDDFVDGTEIIFNKVVFVNTKDEEFEIKL